MATVTGLTAARMLEIEAASVVDGEVVAGNLILTKHDGTPIDAGSVIGPAGPQGPQGLVGIPGEVKLWPGDTLPGGSYGTWVWADGAAYPVSAHPLAAAAIASPWRTFDGKADPGAGNFRVPDLRGLIAAGLDAMPGGSRANRMARAAAITTAVKTGEESHKLILAEMAGHNHGGGAQGDTVTVAGSISGTATDGGSHAHTAYGSYDYVQRVDANAGAANRVTGTAMDLSRAIDLSGPTSTAPNHTHPVGGSFSGSGTIGARGGDGFHENVQPTVFVPYIVCLDG